MVRILFMHPDLGIGGAERLVVDSALALKERNHKVSFLTNHHNQDHCFEETRSQLEVQVVGDWLPRSIFGKLSAACAYARMIYAAFYVLFSIDEKIDVIFCDQISLGIPILHMIKHKPKILFYCHFPDQLLSKPGSFLKSMYRMPLNYMEEKTTGQAEGILVNSKFTSRIFKETFQSLDVIPDVVYPSLNTKYFDETKPSDSDAIQNIPENTFMILSLNRYERKKNLPLALKTLKSLEASLSKPEWHRLHLVMAGGYDPRNLENLAHYDELTLMAEEMNLSLKITFLKSPSDASKLWLLNRCQVLLYTPENEHFGIVPLEGMYLGKPVIAVNSGGPTETIVNEQTGFLCDPDEKEFGDAVTKLIRDPQLAQRMGSMGRKRVQQRFSFEAFTEKLDNIVRKLVEKKNN